MTLYALEEYTPEEQRVLDRYFTNSDRPVFALLNLPEIVKGALFARYSRTHTPLRRLFLDEFYKLSEVGFSAIADEVAAAEGFQGGESESKRRAEELYDRVLIEYGDDSVAQLGGAHLACEQASAIAMKAIERGRLAAYLEQSTRYIRFDSKVSMADGSRRYRYVIPPEIEDAALRREYVARMDALFGTYSSLVRSLRSYFEKRFPKDADTTDRAYATATRARAFDVARGLLPAATFSNVGVFATGQAYESMLIRMRSHPLSEVRSYADEILTELRKLIPGFLKRVDVPDRGGRWSQYFADIETEMRRLAPSIDLALTASNTRFDYNTDEVRLIDWEMDADAKLTAAALFAYSDLSETEIRKRVDATSDTERSRIISAYLGDRSSNRRHRPGRGFERVNYRFEILSDFGSFRDLQRHRMMTLEWQLLGARHGYSTPPEVAELGETKSAMWHDAMTQMAELSMKLQDRYGADVAQYAIPFAYRIRYVIQLNARQAMHMLELRTGQAGHPDYRRICLKMHDLIRVQAGHKAIADAMLHLDATDTGLGRLSAEQRRDERGDTDLKV